jgi:hypothetical protein
VFQPAHCIVSLKNLTATLASSSVLKKTFKVHLSLMKCLKSSQIFCLINMGQSQVLTVSVCSGVVFQPAHCIASLKNLTATSVSSSVLRETFKVHLSLMKCQKSSQFVCLLPIFQLYPRQWTMSS